ncbi:hypothetical protein ACP4OV_010222 [Aristida adscensionis]
MQSSFQILRMEGSGLGLAVLTDVSMELWERKADANNVAGWMLLKTIKLDKLLSLTMPTIKPRTAILGYDEDGNTMFVSFDSEIFKIQLDSMQFESFQIRFLQHLLSFHICLYYSAAALAVEILELKLRKAHEMAAFGSANLFYWLNSR